MEVNLSSKVIKELRNSSNLTISDFKKRYGIKSEDKKMGCYKYKKCSRCGKYNGTSMKLCAECRKYLKKYSKKK